MMPEITTLKQNRTVYGTLLNDRAALNLLSDQFNVAPYKAAPVAPILYIKPRNTWAKPGSSVGVPHDVEGLEIGATLGVVIGKTASHVKVSNALDYVAGYTIVNDINVPHSSFYRPSIRYKCRDGFCPISSFVVPKDFVSYPDNLRVKVEFDGVLVHEASTGGRVRNVAQLIADVTEFMTLHPGDILSIGVAAGAPVARAGQTVRVSIEGLGVLENRLILEAKV